jgi:hypothetical protein
MEEAETKRMQARKAMALRWKSLSPCLLRQRERK